MTPDDYFRHQLEAEIDVTLDVETRQIFRATIASGPKTPEWSQAITILGLRHAGRSHQPKKGWERDVLHAISRPTLWQRVWPFLITIPLGLLIGYGIAPLVARWWQ